MRKHKIDEYKLGSMAIELCNGGCNPQEITEELKAAIHAINEDADISISSVNRWFEKHDADVERERGETPEVAIQVQETIASKKILKLIEHITPIIEEMSWECWRLAKCGSVNERKVKALNMLITQCAGLIERAEKMSGRYSPTKGSKAVFTGDININAATSREAMHVVFGDNEHPLYEPPKQELKTSFNDLTDEQIENLSDSDFAMYNDEPDPDLSNVRVPSEEEPEI